MNSFPLVSVIIPTRNSEQFLEACLQSIKNQTYKNIEIIISDGLSTDQTLSIAKKYKTRIVINKKILADPGVSLGFQEAKGDILIVIAIDNIFKETTAIETIVKVFSDKKIYAAFPKHESTKEDTLFTKYINIFTDPFNHFIYGYAANARTFNKVFKTLKYNELYDLYDFKSTEIKPILALAQGFSIRKDFINKKRNEMDDIEPIINLINEGKQIAYIHSVSLYHHTIRNVWHFIKKQRWATKNALMGKEFGINSRTNTLTPKQKIRTCLFLPYSLSIIFPCINSLLHLIKDRESTWLFHPFITFISGVSILYEYVKIKLGFVKNISRL